MPPDRSAPLRQQPRHDRHERILALRDDMESPTPAVRHAAALELIARDHFLSYSDARHAAQLALSGAHARTHEGS